MTQQSTMTNTENPDDFLKNHRKRDNEQVMDQFREMAGRKAEGDLVPWKDIAALIVSKDSDE